MWQAISSVHVLADQALRPEEPEVSTVRGHYECSVQTDVTSPSLLQALWRWTWGLRLCLMSFLWRGVGFLDRVVAIRSNMWQPGEIGERLI